jgi:hypothetical protein
MFAKRINCEDQLYPLHKRKSDISGWVAKNVLASVPVGQEIP